jgi:phospholipid transport system substrate-binding protein
VGGRIVPEPSLFDEIDGSSSIRVALIDDGTLAREVIVRGNHTRIGLTHLLTLLVLLVPTKFSVVSADEEALNPVTVIQRFEDMGRHERLSAAVLESHHFPTIARVVAGKHWKRQEPEQQILLTDTFSELSVATYAGQFNSYSGENFKIGSERRFGQDKAVVRAVLSRPGGKKRQFDYMLKRFDGAWRIVNITVNGVSDLAIKRVEFRSVIEDKGFDALIVKLREKISLYEAGS